MPVTFHPAAHRANSIEHVGEFDDLCPMKFLGRVTLRPVERVLQSSLDVTLQPPNTIRPQRTGFVGTVMEAYNCHRALHIRPDDVWLAILWYANLVSMASTV